MAMSHETWPFRQPHPAGASASDPDARGAGPDAGPGPAPQRAHRAILHDMSRRAWLFTHVLFATITLACTAPPRPVEAQPAPAPPVHVRISVTTPAARPPISTPRWPSRSKSALSRVPVVRQIYTRSADDRVDLAVTLTDAGAIAVVRDALASALPQLPDAAEHPLITRVDGVRPALALATQPEFAATMASALERTAGVGRVDLCGVGERRTAVILDRTRLAGVALDRLIAAVTDAVAQPDPAPLHERLATLPIAGELRLRDVAVLQDGVRPPSCRAWTARGPVALVTAFTQSGADPAKVAADARPHAVDLVSPTVDFFADPLPAEGGDLAVLALELRPRDDLGPALAGCLAAVPGLPAWGLTVAEPDPADLAARARLHVGVLPTFPIEHVRNAMSRCAGVKRIAVLAPAADADHGLSLSVQGPDLDVCAGLAGRLAERLASLPGVTGLQVRAPRPRPAEIVVERSDLAARGVSLDAVVGVLRLAGGVLTVPGPRRELAVDIELLDRTGPVGQLLRELHVSSASGPIPLSELTRMQASASAPRYRIDLRPGRRRRSSPSQRRRRRGRPSRRDRARAAGGRRRRPRRRAAAESIHESAVTRLCLLVPPPAAGQALRAMTSPKPPTPGRDASASASPSSRSSCCS